MAVSAYWDYFTLDDLMMEDTMVYLTLVSKDINKVRINPIRICIDIRDISSIISNIASANIESKIYPLYPVKESFTGNIVLNALDNYVYISLDGVGIFKPYSVTIILPLKDKNNFIEAISTLIFVELMGKK